MLVILCSIFIVGFVAVLQRPQGPGILAPSWLPVLLIAWAVLAALTMLLHTELPTPNSSASERLFPDSTMQVRICLRHLSWVVLSAEWRAHASGLGRPGRCHHAPVGKAADSQLISF